MAQKVCSLLISPEKFQQMRLNGSLVLDSRGPTGKKPLATLLQKLVSTLPSVTRSPEVLEDMLDRSSGPEKDLSDLLKNPSGKQEETSTNTAKLSTEIMGPPWYLSKMWYQRIKWDR